MSDPFLYLCYSCQKEKENESDMIELVSGDFPICKECWSELDPNHRAWISVFVHSTAKANLPDFRRSNPN